MRFDVLVEIRLLPGIADPQGATVERALPALGFNGISGVRVGKAIRFTVEAAGDDEAESLAGEITRRLLSNPVIEESNVTVVESLQQAPAKLAGDKVSSAGGRRGRGAGGTS